MIMPRTLVSSAFALLLLASATIAAPVGPQLAISPSTVAPGVSTDVTLSASSLTAGDTCVLFTSLASGTSSIGGVSLDLDGPLFYFILGTADGLGELSLTATGFNAPVELDGVTIYLQLIDASQDSEPVLTVTNAVSLAVSV